MGCSNTWDKTCINVMQKNSKFIFLGEHSSKGDSNESGKCYGGSDGDSDIMGGGLCWGP